MNRLIASTLVLLDCIGVPTAGLVDNEDPACRAQQHTAAIAASRPTAFMHATSEGRQFGLTSLFRLMLVTLMVAGGLAFASSAAAAFPDAYCTRACDNGVESTTLAAIDGIAGPSLASTSGATANEDFTAIIGQLAPSDHYGISPLGTQTVNDGDDIALTLTPNARFAEGSRNGTRGGSSSLVCSGPINHSIQNSVDGTSVDWITGDIRDWGMDDYHFNPYNNGIKLTFWWGTGAPSIAGVSSSPTMSDFLVLQIGDTVGPSSTWSTVSNPGPAAWAAGADGYLGFRFDCSALSSPPPGDICYGYVHLTTTAPSGFPATIVDYCYGTDGDELIIDAQPVVTHTVTPGISSGDGTITPDTPQTVNDGNDIVFTLTPDAGFELYSVGGTCGGSFDSTPSEYTTDPVTADCTVVANFQLVGAPHPVIDVNPGNFTVTLEEGDVGSDTLVISNIGDGTLAWSLDTSATFAGGTQGTLATVLYDQTGNETGEAWLAFYNLDDPDTSETQAADDFTVPVGETWWVQEVFVSGSYTYPYAQTTSVNVFIYADDGGKPGVEEAAFLDLAPSGGVSGALNISLPSAVILNHGTYWLSVQPVRDWYDDGGWYWFLVSGNYGAEFHWRNPGDGFGTGCVTWGNATDCLGATSSNLSLRILGQTNGGDGTMCDNPSTSDWLSSSPASGNIAAGGSDSVTIGFDAGTLAAGGYNAYLCVHSNDSVDPLVVVPMALTVTPSTVAVDPGWIFCDGFEDGGDGSCDDDGSTPPGSGNDVITGTIGESLPQDSDGLAFNFANGDAHPYDFNLVDNINVYDFGVGMSVYWYSGATSLDVGGVVTSGIDFAVLQPGDTVGPSQTFSATATQMTSWFGGEDGYIGVAFENLNTGELNYGYIHMTTSAPDGYPAEWLDYAYDQTGAAITIP